MGNYGMYQGYNVEGSADIKITPEATSMPTSTTACSVEGCNCLPGVVCPPVYECPQERCIHREIVHEVPHVVPVNTKIINHHIYKHTFSPCFTCCEENEVCNVVESGCCNHRCC